MEVLPCGQSFSPSDHVGTKANEQIGELVFKYRESETGPDQSVDYYNLTESNSTTRGHECSHGHSVVVPEHSDDSDFNYGHSYNGKQQICQSQPTVQSCFDDSQYILFQKHLESPSFGNQSGFSPNERQLYTCNESIDSYHLSSDSNNRNQIYSSNNSFPNLYCIGTEQCIYLPSATILGEGTEGQEPGYTQPGTICKYNQFLDGRKSRTRGNHETGKMKSGSAYLDSNTPLYTYVQEQKSYYFE
jgi:hypothetical protein|nr:unnamed protein product [Mus musculus]